MDNLEIKNFIVEFKNKRTEISCKDRPDKGIITIEHILTEKELKNVQEILKFNENWDMIVYLVCDYLTDSRIKYK